MFCDENKLDETDSDPGGSDYDGTLKDIEWPLFNGIDVEIPRSSGCI